MPPRKELKDKRKVPWNKGMTREEMEAYKQAQAKGDRSKRGTSDEDDDVVFVSEERFSAGSADDVKVKKELNSGDEECEQDEGEDGEGGHCATNGEGEMEEEGEYEGKEGNAYGEFDSIPDEVEKPSEETPSAVQPSQTLPVIKSVAAKSYQELEKDGVDFYQWEPAGKVKFEDSFVVSEPAVGGELPGDALQRAALERDPCFQILEGVAKCLKTYDKNGKLVFQENADEYFHMSSIVGLFNTVWIARNDLNEVSLYGFQDSDYRKALELLFVIVGRDLSVSEEMKQHIERDSSGNEDKLFYIMMRSLLVWCRLDSDLGTEIFGRRILQSICYFLFLACGEDVLRRNSGMYWVLLDWRIMLHYRQSVVTKSQDYDFVARVTEDVDIVSKYLQVPFSNQRRTVSVCDSVRFFIKKINYFERWLMKFGISKYKDDVSNIMSEIICIMDDVKVLPMNYALIVRDQEKEAELLYVESIYSIPRLNFHNRNSDVVIAFSYMSGAVRAVEVYKLLGISAQSFTSTVFVSTVEDAVRKGVDFVIKYDGRSFCFVKLAERPMFQAKVAFPDSADIDFYEGDKLCGGKFYDLGVSSGMKIAALDWLNLRFNAMQSVDYFILALRCFVHCHKVNYKFSGVDDGQEILWNGFRLDFHYPPGCKLNLDIELNCNRMNVLLFCFQLCGFDHLICDFQFSVGCKLMRTFESRVFADGSILSFDFQKPFCFKIHYDRDLLEKKRVAEEEQEKAESAAQAIAQASTEADSEATAKADSEATDKADSEATDKADSEATAKADSEATDKADSEEGKVVEATKVAEESKSNEESDDVSDDDLFDFMSPMKRQKVEKTEVEVTVEKVESWIKDLGAGDIDLESVVQKVDVASCMFGKDGSKFWNDRLASLKAGGTLQPEDLVVAYIQAFALKSLQFQDKGDDSHAIAPPAPVPGPLLSPTSSSCSSGCSNAFSGSDGFSVLRDKISSVSGSDFEQIVETFKEALKKKDKNKIKASVLRACKRWIPVFIGIKSF